MRPGVPPSGPGQDSAPLGNVDVSLIPEPVPRAEPRAQYGNHSPYTVLGRSYRVMDSADGYRERCIASGMADVLLKPINRTDLAAVLARYGAPEAATRTES